MIIRIIFLACLSLIFSSNVLGQTCETRYRSCVRRCNANRDQALSKITSNETRSGLDSAKPLRNVTFSLSLTRWEDRNAAELRRQPPTLTSRESTD